MYLLTEVLRHAPSYQPESKSNMSDFIENNTNDDGVGRLEVSRERSAAIVAYLKTLH
jgi:hypothetical protein